MKNPFGSGKTLLEIAETFLTLFYLYDEEGFRRIDGATKKSFSWNTGYREYSLAEAVLKPCIPKLMHDPANGQDFSSYKEQRLRFPGEKIMFSSSEMPAMDPVLTKKLNMIPSSASII